MNPSPRLILLPIITILAANMTFALTVYEPLGDMLEATPVVVIATVGTPRTTLDPRAGIAYREYPITITTVVKGGSPGISSIALPGGDLPNGLQLWVSDTPELLAGHEYLLFLDLEGRLQFGPAGALEVVNGQLPSLAGAPADFLIHLADPSSRRQAPTAPGSEILSRTPEPLEQPDASTPIKKWPYGAKVSFYYYPDFSWSSVVQIDNGAIQWDNVVHCVWLADVGYSWKGLGYNGTNSILHAYLPTNILAQTWVWSSYGTILEFDMQFNVNKPWTNYCAAGKYDTWTVAVHEFGHSLGLDHNWNTCSVLYPYVGAGQCKRYLCSLDVNNLRALYGCN